VTTATNTASIDPQQACAWLRSGEALLVDVREPDEFKTEHIAAAASLPLSAVGGISDLMAVPADRKIIFQCLKGGRGQAACEAVAGRVPNNVYNLSGGITAWKEAGLPVVADGATAPRVSIFRQVQMIVGTLVLAGVVLGFAGLTLGFVLAGLFGGALAFAGMSGWCGLALLLARMPWNRK
jgi:rhodanese-related sulfurtransferase